MPKPRQRTLPKSTAKRVSFMDVTELEKQVKEKSALVSLVKLSFTITISQI